MNFQIIFYFVVIILSWTANPFLKKIILKRQHLNTDELFVLNYFVITVILVVYFVYLFRTKKCSTTCIRNIDRFDLLYILLGALTSIIGARLILTIIQYKDISYMVAHIQPIIITLTFLIGYLFFSETITLYKIIGIGLVILGIIFLNKKNIK